MRKTLEQYENLISKDYVRYYSDQGHDIIPVYFESFDQITKDGDKEIECHCQLRALQLFHKQEINYFRDISTISIKHLKSIRDWDDNSDKYWEDQGECAKEAIRMISNV